MRYCRSVALLLAGMLLLLCGCGSKTVPGPDAGAETSAPPAAEQIAETTAEATREPVSESVRADTPVPAEAAAPAPVPTQITAAAPEPVQNGRLSFTEEEGPEEGVRMTCWSYAGNEVASFYAFLLPAPEGFPPVIGTMYEGPEAALLTGVVSGDRESGTAELLLVTADDDTDTLLTFMYARDRVALLELDADMRSYTVQDPVTGLYLVVFTEEGPISFADAGLLLEETVRQHALVPAYAQYGLEGSAVTDLRVPVSE